jgi:hypothetical protein
MNGAPLPKKRIILLLTAVATIWLGWQLPAAACDDLESRLYGAGHVGRNDAVDLHPVLWTDKSTRGVDAKREG